MGFRERVNPLKKKKLGWKSFSGNAERNYRTFGKIISADIKTDAKQELEKLVASCIITCHRGSFSKLEIKGKTGLYFSFNLG